MCQSLDKSTGQEAKTTRNQLESEGELSVDARVDAASKEISTHSSKSYSCCPTTYGTETAIWNKSHCSNVARSTTLSGTFKTANPEALGHEEINLLDPKWLRIVDF